MRIFAIVIASMGLFANLTYAADDGAPFMTKLPDSEDGTYHHVYVFTLKKNGISLRMSGEAFCSTMGYGSVVEYERRGLYTEAAKDKKVVFEGRPKTIEGKEIVDGDLEWVICRAQVDINDVKPRAR